MTGHRSIIIRADLRYLMSGYGATSEQGYYWECHLDCGHTVRVAKKNRNSRLPKAVICTQCEG